MIDQLVEKVFCARNATHLAHWSTKSFAEHMALGDFYDESIEILDKLIEAYQGNFGLIKVSKLDNEVGKDVIKMLNDQVTWISENREDISSKVCALENIIDELTGLYLSTIYKLENLS